jgi:PAS domain S-box-containing protein
MSSRHISDSARTIAGEFAAIAVAVALLDWISLYVAQQSIHVTTLWPAKGLVLALCLMLPREKIVRVLAAAIVGGIAGKLAIGDPLIHAALGTAISALSIVATWWGTTILLDGKIDFREWKKLATFIAVSAGVALTTGILGAIFTVSTRGGGFETDWLYWSLATSLSFAILTPPIALTVTRPVSEHVLPDRRVKVVISALATGAITLCAFGQAAFPVTYLVPIALLITSLVAEIDGASWALLATAVVSITCTIFGWGPSRYFGGSVTHHVLVVQFFLAALTIGILPAAAAITERRTLRDRLVNSLAAARYATSALAESEERYRLLAENATDLIVRVSESGDVVYVSPSCRAYGYEPDELLGSSTRLVHPDDLTRLNESSAELLSGKPVDSSRNREHRFRAKNGEWVWLEGKPSILRDESGERCGFLNVFRDVTARKAMEAELIDARERAEAGAQAKSDFLANMSHELRTPLTGVIGFADLLNDTCELDEKSRRYAERVRGASRALLSTINDILDYSKLENGQIEFAPEPVQIAQRAREAVELFAPSAQSKGIELELTCAPNLAETSLSLDPHRLGQVLLNLVGNAVKFTTAGKVSVRMTRDATLRESRSHQTLRVEIEDTGPGIPADGMDRLFKRFSQVDRSTSRAHGGTGLGLAICKGLVEAMGGRIGVSSEVGKGSLFWFEIPAIEIGQPLEEPGPFPTAGGEANAGGPARSPARVLVVDDNDANRQLIRAYLELRNIAVTEAPSGEIAVVTARTDRFDLIVMDLQMPGMSGVSAMRAIRAQAGLSAKMPIVACTADGDSARLAALRREGFDGILSKPIAIDALMACVADALSAGVPAVDEPVRHVA